MPRTAHCTWLKPQGPERTIGVDASFQNMKPNKKDIPVQLRSRMMKIIWGGKWWKDADIFWLIYNTALIYWVTFKLKQRQPNDR